MANRTAGTRVKTAAGKQTWKRKQKFFLIETTPGIYCKRCPIAPAPGVFPEKEGTPLAKEQIREANAAAPTPSWIFKLPPQQGPLPDKEAAAVSSLKDELFEKIAASGRQVRLSLYDYAAQRWIEHQADLQFYPASMIKTLLLLAALELAEGGKLLLERPHLLTESDKYAGKTPVAGSGILQFATAGSSYTLRELLRLMVTLSDNVAANIIFERVGAANCAATAKRLGLTESVFSRKLYDLESKLPSNKSTARELTRMLLALQNREAAGEEFTRAGIEMMAATALKDRIGRFIGEQAVVANKVGTVDGIVGDMALLYFPHRPPLALTVAVEHPPDREDAAHLIGTLAAAVVRKLAPRRRT